ncbi:MAG TPA: hypothetical protein VE620_09260 [Myxococcales bacterium]|jgi:hypothetical protein|nr:hypothetical protein [Myxococcales bacterium]
MKRAGPTFLTWMIGRIAHPLSADRCDRCGKSADGTGPNRLLRGPLLCGDCRRARLIESLRGSAT